MNRILAALILLGTLYLTSCSNDLEKIPTTPFATQKLEKWDDPFDGIWVDPTTKTQKTPKRTLYIAPTTINFLTPPMDDAKDQQTAQQLASYLDNKLKQDLGKLPAEQIILVDSPKKAEVMMEIALVTIKPTKSYLNYLSMGTSFFVPYVSSVFSKFSSGEMVMVCKFSDAQTKKPMAIMADYRPDEPALLGSFRDYTRFGHHYKTIDMWSNKLTQRLAARIDEKVAPPIWITLNPF